MKDQEKAQLLELIDYLENKDVHYIFCTHGLMQWQITFYSQQRVIARCVNTRDRYPAYIERVNKALNASDANIAMVGPWGKQSPENPEGVVFIEEQYFIYLNPTKSLLEDEGFSLPN